MEELALGGATELSGGTWWRFATKSVLRLGVRRRSFMMVVHFANPATDGANEVSVPADAPFVRRTRA